MDHVVTDGSERQKIGSVETKKGRRLRRGQVGAEVIEAETCFHLKPKELSISESSCAIVRSKEIALSGARKTFHTRFDLSIERLQVLSA